MERIERMSGPLVLRVRHETGIVSYWNWDAINRFQFDAEIGGFFFTDGSFHRLSPAEYRQVQEQLDTLIDPPTYFTNGEPTDPAYWESRYQHYSKLIRERQRKEGE